MSDLTHISWSCEHCGFPIADGAGFLGVPFRDLSAKRTGIHWTPQHNTCSTEDTYGIDVADLRDATGAVKWTAHLIEKPWIRDTDWASVLRAIDGGVPA